MASIEGRPRPDFTARVMARIETKPRARGRGMGAAFVLVPASMLLAAGAIMLRPARTGFPDVAPPREIRAAVFGSAIEPTVLLSEQWVALEDATNGKTDARRAAGPQRQPDAPLLPAIHTIAALEEPTDIAMKSIDPASCTVPALAGPAPLKVADLPATAGGSKDREFKERP
jgi:hypothetical protein